MSSLGTLTLNLVAKTGSFEKGMTKAQRSSARFERMVKRDMKSARKELKSIGMTAAAMAAGIGALTVGYANNARELRKMADVSNMTVAEFQAMAVGAKTVGIENEKLADILKDVNDRVGDFIQTGGGPMADFFENIAPKVGVTAEQFRKLGGKDALLLYVDSLKKAGLNQQDMTFYMEAMASDATNLIPLLENGGAKLDEWGESAKNAGAIMSNDTAVSAKLLSEEIAQLQLQSEGLQNQLMSAMIPSMTEAASAARVFVSDAESLDSTMDVAKNGAILLGGVMAGNLVSKVMKATGAVKGLVVVKKSWATVTSLNRNKLKRLGAAITNGTAATKSFTVAARAAKGVMSALGGPVGVLVSAIGFMYSFGDSADDTAGKVRSLAGDVRGLTRDLGAMSMAQAKAARQDLKIKLIQAKSESRAAQKEREKAIAATKNYNQGGPRGDGGWQDNKFETIQKERLANAQDNLDISKDNIKEIANALSEVNSFISSDGKSHQPATAAAVAGAGNKSDYKSEVEAARLAVSSYNKELGILKDSLTMGTRSQADYDSRLKELKATLDKTKGATALLNAETKGVAGGGKGGRSGGGASKRVQKLSKDIEKLGESYKDLKRSLAGDENNKLETLKEQLATIEKMRALQAAGRASVSTAELDETRNKAVSAAFSNDDMPSYEMAGAGLGGAFGELSQIAEKQVALEEWRTQQLASLRAFHEQKLISEQEYQDRKNAIQEQSKEQEEALAQATQATQLAAAGQMFGSMAAMAKKHAGEQSGIYRAMFVAQKAFAIASAMVNIQKAISEASTLPFPANLGAMATVASNVGSIVSNISAIAMPQGMAHSGIDSVPETGTWLLEKGERVVTSQTSAKLDATLERVNSGGGMGGGNHIEITVNVTADGESEDIQSKNQQGKELANMIKGSVLAIISDERRPGGMLA